MQLVPDPEIIVTFPIVGDPDKAAFVAWTTTPWTLPSNLALCVNANFTYVKVSSFIIILLKGVTISTCLQYSVLFSCFINSFG